MTAETAEEGDIVAVGKTVADEIATTLDQGVVGTIGGGKRVGELLGWCPETPPGPRPARLADRPTL